MLHTLFLLPEMAPITTMVIYTPDGAITAADFIDATACLRFIMLYADAATPY